MGNYKACVMFKKKFEIIGLAVAAIVVAGVFIFKKKKTSSSPLAGNPDLIVLKIKEGPEINCFAPPCPTLDTMVFTFNGKTFDTATSIVSQDAGNGWSVSADYLGVVLSKNGSIVREFVIEKTGKYKV